MGSEKVEQYSTLSQVLSQRFSNGLQYRKIYERYSLFNGYFHIKWYILIKNVLFLSYLLRMIQLDHVQLELSCSVLTNYQNEYKNVPCIRSICLWLHQVTGLLPRFLVIDNSYICLIFLIVGLLSSSLLLLALYWHEQGDNERISKRCVSYLLVAPSIILEIFVIFFCFYGVIMSLEWRLKLWKTPSYWLTIRALFFTVILSAVLLGEIVLHLISVKYLIDSSVMYYPVMHKEMSSPSESVLEVLKNPLIHVRSNNLQLIKGNAVPHLNSKLSPYDTDVPCSFRDSGNVTFESSGYGKCRQKLRDRNSLASAEEVLSARDRNFGFRSLYQFNHGDCGDTNGTISGSEYQQIKPIFMQLPGNASQGSMEQDTTYLEVV